jgi:hypothetical protein
MTWTEFYAGCTNAELLHYWHDADQMIRKSVAMPSTTIEPLLERMELIECQISIREMVQSSKDFNAKQLSNNQ